MPYPDLLVQPMREDLTRLGFRELRSADDVDDILSNVDGPVLVVVNSVCGCAAGALRPGVALSLQGDVVPPVLTTVFAGQDMEATAKVRDFFTGYPPSSPAVALLRDGDLVYMMERHQIEGRGPEAIAADLKAAYQEHCGAAA
ncbi:MAG: BrxA/BrxB family bacilliredoxin [Gemmatimonadales bacterium]|nr:MAG: BrxA/BrxB family bacilliredoxin [Gemmatimonadales bacterium]